MYHHHNNRLADLIVDGGVTDNYPLHVLKEQKCIPRNILGFKLCDNNEKNEYIAMKDDTIDEDVDHGVPTNVRDFFVTLLDIIRQQALRYHVENDEWKLTCKIDIGKYQSTDFRISEEGKLWLYNSGRNAMDKYLREIEEMLDQGIYPLQ